MDLKRVGKQPLEMLARAGAFDQLDANRRRVFRLSMLWSATPAQSMNKASNQVSLLVMRVKTFQNPDCQIIRIGFQQSVWTRNFAPSGSGHPLDDYMSTHPPDVMTMEELLQKVQSGPRVAKLAGVVSGRQERKSARGNRFCATQ